MKRAAPPTLGRISPVIGTVLRRFEGEHQIEAYRIWTFWSEEVGPHIARRAQPTRFRNGILFVAVSTHSWLQELQFMKDDLRERLNQRLATPLVRDIYFVSGAVEEVAPQAPPAKEELAPIAAAPIALPHLDDADLASAFARLATHVARRQAQVAGRFQAPRGRRRR